MPILKKITSCPALKKKKKNKAQNNIVKKEAQSPKQLGCKNKIKAQGVANEQMIETGQKPNYGQLGGQGTKKYSKTTKMIKSKQEI